MTLVAYIASAVGFFALVMASIALHEIGHLVPAKLFGVKVTQYFVGFGKTLWSRKHGETEYGFKAIPLGGYVRLVGMYPPGKPSRPGRLAELAEDARAAEWANITPEDVAGNRLFYQKKTWQKLIVMFGGPAMNILLAFLIFLGVNLSFGQVQPSLTVGAVMPCIEEQAQQCTPTPAAAMGLKAGDTITAVGGVTVKDWADLSARIRANGRNPISLTVDRSGQGSVTLGPVPGATRQVQSTTDPSQTVTAGYVGVQPSGVRVPVGPVQTVKDMWQMTTVSVGALISFPVKVYQTAADMITGKPRDVNGPLSVVGAAGVAGEIATTGDLTTGSRIASWFYLLGSVNLFVALLNLVPLLPFDGGHIAGAIWEWLRRTAARLFKRDDPGYVDTAKLLPVAYVVGGFLLLSGLVLIVADIISPIKIF